MNTFNMACSSLASTQLRRQIRLRREYIYRKSIEDKERTIQEKKRRLQQSIDSK